jgi:hypothetical protein
VLESFLYTKNETELENFAASVKIDGDIGSKSKIAITSSFKNISRNKFPKRARCRLNLNGFVKLSVDSLKPKPQTNSESELALRNRSMS